MWSRIALKQSKSTGVAILIANASTVSFCDDFIYADTYNWEEDMLNNTLPQGEKLHIVHINLLANIQRICILSAETETVIWFEVTGVELVAEEIDMQKKWSECS